MSVARSFLFLQGLASRFFERLGAALGANGHLVSRVNFNGGDRVFWRLPGAVNYRGQLGDWPQFLDRLLVERRITDIVLFGDCRPVHRLAIPIARVRSARVHVVEEGYLRPGWITFEEGGVNANSSLPRDPVWYREAAAQLPAWRDSPAPPESFARRAVEDVHYTAARLAAAGWYPHYRTHRTRHPLVEYVGCVGRLAGRQRADRQANMTLAGLAGSEDPTFLFPLQLDGDYQLRNSSFGGMRPAVERVVASFAQYAPPDARLLVKLHPLDDGLTNWPRAVRKVAAACGVAGRVIVLDGGAIEAVLPHTRAMVTINSTAAMQALGRRLPVIALGRAVYDLPGLTFQGSLDRFWRTPAPPDLALYDAFRRVLAARAMIPGGFFSEAGLQIAVAAAIERLEADMAPQSGRAVIEEPAPLVDTELAELST